MNPSVHIGTLSSPKSIITDKHCNLEYDAVCCLTLWFHSIMYDRYYKKCVGKYYDILCGCTVTAMLSLSVCTVH